MKFLDKIGYKKILIVVVLLSVCYFLSRLYNGTNTFADVSIFRPDYLSFEDYQLFDLESGKQKTNTRSIFYDGERDYSYYYDDIPELKTSKGFKVGDTFEEFVELYGDYYAKAFSAYESDYSGERDEEYYSSHYVYSSMKVKDYYEKYIVSGDLDPSKNDIMISFEMYIRGNEVAYSEKEYDELIHKYYSSSMPGGSIFNPNIQTYSLDFGFREEDGIVICYSINANRYVNSNFFD